MKSFSLCLAVLFLFSCRPLVTTFAGTEDAILYVAASNSGEPQTFDYLKVMTWNIRFGAGRIPWFGDSCGERVLMTESETLGHLNDLADFINQADPDILLLQEVDVSSKRSAYIDQLQWLLDHTEMNYGAYASMWSAEIIPSDGLGRVDVGNAILSRWPITEAERIQLPLRTDQDAITQYFYLRRNILKCKIDLPIEDEFYAVDIHATAFATDDTKQKHIDKYKEVLDELNVPGTIFVSGGDLNSIPPGAEIDYCMEDICSGESFHTDNESSPHKEGSYFANFEGEPELLQPFYSSYISAIEQTISNDASHHTHCTWNSDEVFRYWDRKLDYLFTNYGAWESGNTHQEAFDLSDHAPVSAILIFPNE